MKDQQRVDGVWPAEQKKVSMEPSEVQKEEGHGNASQTFAVFQSGPCLRGALRSAFLFASTVKSSLEPNRQNLYINMTKSRVTDASTRLGCAKCSALLMDAIELMKPGHQLDRNEAQSHNARDMQMQLYVNEAQVILD